MVALLLVSAPVIADDDEDDDDKPVVKTGKCTGTSTYKLTVSEADDDDDTIVKMEVDQNKNNIAWTVKFYYNNQLFSTGQYTTKAPGGAFVAQKTNDNESGTFKVVATRRGESCTASAYVDFD